MLSRVQCHRLALIVRELMLKLFFIQKFYHNTIWYLCAGAHKVIVNFIVFSGQSYDFQNNINWLTAKTIIHILDASTLSYKKGFSFII